MVWCGAAAFLWLLCVALISGLPHLSIAYICSHSQATSLSLSFSLSLPHHTLINTFYLPPEILTSCRFVCLFDCGNGAVCVHVCDKDDDVLLVILGHFSIML